MSFVLKGTIHEIMDTQTFESGFAKREFVIQTDSEYPQMVKFEIVKGKNAEKDKTKVLNGYQPNEPVEVFFDIRGNEYNGKYYNNLVCWKIDRQEHTSQAQPERKEPTPSDDDGDDLPF